MNQEYFEDVGSVTEVDCELRFISTFVNYLDCIQTFCFIPKILMSRVSPFLIAWDVGFG